MLSPKRGMGTRANGLGRMSPAPALSGRSVTLGRRAARRGADIRSIETQSGAAFNAKTVLASLMYERLATAAIIVLMVTKPF
jgi:hypothetical protein